MRQHLSRTVLSCMLWFLAVCIFVFVISNVDDSRNDSSNSVVRQSSNKNARSGSKTSTGKGSEIANVEGMVKPITMHSNLSNTTIEPSTTPLVSIQVVDPEGQIVRQGSLFVFGAEKSFEPQRVELDPSFDRTELHLIPGSYRMIVFPESPNYSFGLYDLQVTATPSVQTAMIILEPGREVVVEVTNSKGEPITCAVAWVKIDLPPGFAYVSYTKTFGENRVPLVYRNYWLGIQSTGLQNQELERGGWEYLSPTTVWYAGCTSPRGFTRIPNLPFRTFSLTVEHAFQGKDALGQSQYSLVVPTGANYVAVKTEFTPFLKCDKEAERRFHEFNARELEKK